MYRSTESIGLGIPELVAQIHIQPIKGISKKHLIEKLTDDLERKHEGNISISCRRGSYIFTAYRF